jgi:hypothetical protein
VKYGLKVALLGPANKANGIIMALLLISRVITTGSIGTAHLKREFFFVKEIATQIKPSDPTKHNATSLTTSLGCNMHWLT